MRSLTTAFGESIAVLFPIVNPLGVAPTFVALTAGRTPADRAALLRRVVVAVAAVLIVFCIVGEQVLHFLGVSLEALQIAGGIIVGFAGFQMIVDTEAFLAVGAESETDPALTPLAVPLLAGPGAMAALMGLDSRESNFAASLPGTIAGILVVCALTWVVFTAGERLTRGLGKGGLLTITLLFGLVTLAIGVEMVVHGIAEHGAVVKS